MIKLDELTRREAELMKDVIDGRIKTNFRLAESSIYGSSYKEEAEELMTIRVKLHNFLKTS